MLEIQFRDQYSHAEVRVFFRPSRQKIEQYIKAGHDHSVSCSSLTVTLCRTYEAEGASLNKPRINPLGAAVRLELWPPPFQGLPTF
jgi:hypothetical protein